MRNIVPCPCYNLRIEITKSGPRHAGFNVRDQHPGPGRAEGHSPHSDGRAGGMMSIFRVIHKIIFS